jgi:hypothetical protein
VNFDIFTNGCTTMSKSSLWLENDGSCVITDMGTDCDGNCLYVAGRIEVIGAELQTLRDGILAIINNHAG